MGFKDALEFLGRGETPSDKALEPELTPKNVTLEDLRAVAVDALESKPARDSSQPLAKERPAKPAEQHVEIEKPQPTAAQIEQIKAEAEDEELARAEAKPVEAATGYECGAEGNLKESAGDGVTPDSTLFLGSKAADELEPERATLAAATILPLSLLGTKKAWVWIVVLVCLAIAAYFLLEWYSRRVEVTSLPREVVKTSSGDPVRDFLVAY